MHSRRLSENIDVNYGDFQTTSNDKFDKELPPPPIEKDEKYQRSTSSSSKTKAKSKKNRNSVRFDLTPVLSTSSPPLKDTNYSLGSSRRKSALKKNGHSGNYSRLPTSNEQKHNHNQFTTINFSDDENTDSLDAELDVLNDSAHDENYNTDRDFDTLFERDDPMFDKDARNKSFWSSLLHPDRDVFEILFYIVGWYTFSISISFYNKWMFDKSKLNFPFPIISTSIHQLMLFILSSILLWFYPTFRPPTEAVFSINYKLLLSSVIPCALATSGDIGCGNMSLRYVTLSLYTMIKSSAIAFVLIFGVIFRLEKLSLELSCIVFVMIFAVVMMVGGSTNTSSNGSGNVATAAASSFDLFLGSSLVVVSSCMSGLRWALTQLLLKTNPYITNPISTMFYLAPWMFITLLLTGSFSEGLLKFFDNEIWQHFGILKTMVALCIPGFLVFFMMIFELRLLQKSHVVTLSIAGIFKELLTILFSSFIFGDKLTIINVIGLIITLLDILWYNYYRYSETIKQSKDNHDSIQEFELRDRL